ncbi:MAG: electron transfer flavoprotein subunit alpha/FixB family protein [Candidatus Aminicenantes bacterium]|nr:MAG: electron transfer flavoprotein subunit alpha/FixB family protein [Candidatus Aminicenantes bacterium]
MKGILICGEPKEKKITSVSKELITTGKGLSSVLDQSLDFLLIGEKCENAAIEAANLGVDRVLTVQGPGSSDLHPERLVAILAQVCKQNDPMVILLGQTDMGRDVAPRLAAKLGANVCMDCVDLVFDESSKELILTKPVYGGNAMAQWALKNHRQLVVTMRPRSEKPAEPDPSHKGRMESISIEFEETQIRTQLMETTCTEGKGIKLEEAKVIVAGGGGIGGSEGFGLIQELAVVLGAAVGITRVPSDENWMPKSLEIGQTGHMVSPNLYIAVGISGAPQHLSGCSHSKIIVAINKDPEASIFGMADFGIVGDYREVLPALIEKLKALKE